MDSRCPAADSAYFSGAEREVGRNLQDGDRALGDEELQTGDRGHERVDTADVVDVGVGEQDAPKGEIAGKFGDAQDVAFGAFEVRVDERVAGVFANQ